MWESFLPMIDWTVSVGNLIQIFSIIGAGLTMFFAMKSDLKVLRHNIKHIEQRQEAFNEAFRQLGTILTQVAVQDSRLSMMEKWIDELRHGRGLIK